MFQNVKWLFFDVGSTIVNEETAYAHRLMDIAGQANVPYEVVYQTAIGFYKKNKKGIRKLPSTLAFPCPHGIRKMKFRTPMPAAVLNA